MNSTLRTILESLVLGLLVFCTRCISRAAENPSVKEVTESGPDQTQQLLQDFCVKCHGEDTQKAKFSLHDIDTEIGSGKDIERWEKTLEMLSLGDMPPENEKQPTRAHRQSVISWIRQELRTVGRGLSDEAMRYPSYGNRVDHESLFSGEHKGPSFTTSRLWRISPHIYYRFAANVDMARKLTSPLQGTGSEGFRDYSLLYADEASIKTMLQNCKRAATTLIHGSLAVTRNRSSTKVVKQGGRRGSRHKVLANFALAETPPTKAQFDEVLSYTFEFLLHRQPNDDDRSRYIDSFLKPNTELAGREAALKAMIAAVMMSPEFLFRTEIGLGEALPDGRRRLSQREIAYALSFALFDYVDASLLKAAEAGKLGSSDQVAAEFRRVLVGRDRTIRPPANRWFWDHNGGAGIVTIQLMDTSHPRLLRFFREFFAYTKVPDVFKDDTRHDGKHDAWGLVRDADWFVLRALKDDQQVLARLLTGNHYFVQSKSRKAIKDARPYNIDSPDEPIEGNPIEMPSGQRAGMLTHPAWLSAHSGNFENDPVRRGKWIQEHLLAGVVPDIPIGVEAQLPEEPHRTLRQRFDVVKKEECWRCHKKMNPLGYPFEAYDDFGRYRNEHIVGEDGKIIASEFEAYSKLRKIAWRQSHKKRAPPEQFGSVVVDASGSLVGTGDPTLDGEVTGPIDLVHRLAKSSRVRQSFVRHVFRYWMGRNELLSDSPTLMAMDRAYVENDGSFRELLVALVCSDSFLYRR